MNFRSYRIGAGDFTLTKHLKETGHCPRQGLKILHVVNKGLKLNFLEALELHKLSKIQGILLKD